MAEAVKKVTSKLAKQRFLCGTPSEHCTGALTKCNSHMKSTKTHDSPEAAFKCHANYLVNVEGYTMGKNREFTKGDGPIRMLTKKSRFGARLRGGKEGRSMPYDFVGGTLVSC